MHTSDTDLFWTVTETRVRKVSSASIACADGEPRTLCEVLSHVEPHVQHTPSFVITFVLKVGLPLRSGQLVTSDRVQYRAGADTVPFIIMTCAQTGDHTRSCYLSQAVCPALTNLPCILS